MNRVVDNENAFFNDTSTLYELSMKMNCENINRLEKCLYDKDSGELKNTMNCEKTQIRKIRNVDYERPMMWCENRFKHFNYCSLKQLDGHYVCKDCKQCRFNSNFNLKNFSMNNICGFNNNNNNNNN